MMRAYCFILLSLTTLLSVSAEEQVFCSDSNIYCVNPALHLKPLLVEHEKRLLPMLPLNAYYNDSLVVLEVMGCLGDIHVCITDLFSQVQISKPVLYQDYKDSLENQSFYYEAIRLPFKTDNCYFQISTQERDTFQAYFGDEEYILLDPPM